jgi:hypothetical protein
MQSASPPKLAFVVFMEYAFHEFPFALRLSFRYMERGGLTARGRSLTLPGIEYVPGSAL